MDIDPELVHVQQPGLHVQQLPALPRGTCSLVGADTPSLPLAFDDPVVAASRRPRRVEVLGPLVMRLELSFVPLHVLPSVFCFVYVGVGVNDRHIPLLRMFRPNPWCVVDDFAESSTTKKKFYQRENLSVIRIYEYRGIDVPSVRDKVHSAPYEPRAVQELSVFSCFLLRRETGAPFLPSAAPAQTLLQREVRRLTRKTYTLQTRELEFLF